MLIGAQAVYLQTGEITLAVAPSTSDADLMIDPRSLADYPEITTLLRNVGFMENLEAGGNPGHWVNPEGIPLDLMYPRVLSKRGPDARSADLQPHAPKTAGLSDGLDCALVDKELRLIESFDPSDSRKFELQVAGPAALIVAKVFKIGDRENQKISRLKNKDALDLYRILRTTDSEKLAMRFRLLLESELARIEAKRGLELLGRLFAESPEALGNQLIASAVQGLEDGQLFASESQGLASNLLNQLER